MMRVDVLLALEFQRRHARDCAEPDGADPNQLRKISNSRLRARLANEGAATMRTQELPTDAIAPGPPEDGAAWLLRLIEDIWKDITPEQQEEMAAAIRAADIEEALEMLERRDALGPCTCGCGARVVLEPEQVGPAKIAG